MIETKPRPIKIELKAKVSGNTTLKIKPGKYVSAALVAIALSLPVSEYIALPLAEKCGLFAGAKAVDHNKQLFFANCMRNWAGSEKPLFKTALLSVDKSAPSPRILVLGDSFVWGDGYANINDLWWMKLSKSLKYKGTPCSVIGSGHPGFSLKSQVRVLPDLLDQVKPDYVICQFIPDDADAGLVSASAAPTPKWIQKAHLRTYKYFPYLSEFIFPKIEQLSAIVTRFGQEASDSQAKDIDLEFLKGESGRQFVSNLQKLKSICDQRNTPLMIATLPTVPDQKYNADHFGPVIKMANDQGIATLDLSKGFIQYCDSVKRKLPLTNLSDLNYFQNILRINQANYHPSVALTTYYGERLADRLMQDNHLQKLISRAHTANAATSPINDTLPTVLTDLRQDKINERSASYYFTFPPQQTLIKADGTNPRLLMHFANPIDLDSIIIESEGDATTTVELTALDNMLGFDSNRVVFKATKTGRHLKFVAAVSNANTLRINISNDRSSRDKKEKQLTLIKSQKPIAARRNK